MCPQVTVPYIQSAHAIAHKPTIKSRIADYDGLTQPAFGQAVRLHQVGNPDIGSGRTAFPPADPPLRMEVLLASMPGCR
jgi:hypothetical protein